MAQRTQDIAPIVAVERKVRSAALVALVIFSVSSAAAMVAPQDSLPRFISITSDTTFVRGAVLDGVPLVPLNEAALAAGASILAIDSLSAVDLRFSTHVVRIIERNPFAMVLVRATGDAGLIQLTASPRRYGGRLYLSLRSLEAILRSATSTPITWLDDRTLVFQDSTAAPGSAFDITGLHVEQRLNGYLMTVRASRPIGTVESWLKPDGWLFLTVENARADTVALRAVRPGGAIRQVLVFQSATSVQITLKVAPDVEAAEVVKDPSSNDLLVNLRTRSVSTQQDLERRRQALRDRDDAERRNRWKLDVVVIDPGHGGKDPGTIGVKGTYEKNVVLGIGLKLGALIKKHMPDVKVVYTRSTDRFVELYRRTQMANEAGGKLFVSIHCNAIERKPSRTNGFEIYLLRPGRTDDAIRVAALENAVIELESDRSRYKQLTEEEFILVTMAQAAYMKHSERFAETAAKALDDHTTLRNGGVKQAGFYVLVGASMPNVLIETGYLSNTKDETYLRSPTGQQQIAEAILKGLQTYKTVYERDVNEGSGGR
jgi:N-acetylmuramoyl-L-alanine amidase